MHFRILEIIRFFRILQHKMLNNAEKVCKKGKDMRKKETSEVTDRLIKYKAYLMTKTDGWIECFG